MGGDGVWAPGKRRKKSDIGFTQSDPPHPPFLAWPRDGARRVSSNRGPPVGVRAFFRNHLRPK